MTSRNAAVYRYHGIFETVYYRRAFSNIAHPLPDVDGVITGCWMARRIITVVNMTNVVDGTEFVAGDVIVTDDVISDDVTLDDVVGGGDIPP